MSFAFNIPSLWIQDRVIIVAMIIWMISSTVGVYIEQPLLCILFPILIGGIYLLLFKIQWIFYALFFLIPLSAELELPGGFSTDLAAEPILWLLFTITIVLIFTRGVTKKIRSLITVLLAVHLFWLFCSSFFSELSVVGLKFSLAKSWYILPFYILPFYILEDHGKIRTVLKCFVTGVGIAATYFFIQHLQTDLSFLTRTNAGQPIWRNHVNYACTLVVSLPIVIYLFRSSVHPDRWLYIVVLTLFSVFIYFAYARIAYISVAAALLYTFVLKWKLSRVFLLSSIALVLASLFWLDTDNRYVHLAPKHESAIMQLDFQRKISATTTGQDISTMERLHRWVAGGRMINEKPITGFGPGSFYRSYVPFGLFSFETYVSDNPDKSGVHNYFLMTLVEQGYIGFLVFLILIIVVLLKLEKATHLSTDRNDRLLIQMIASVLIMILTINLVNDMIEVVKIGSLFFFSLFILQWTTKVVHSK